MSASSPSTHWTSRQLLMVATALVVATIFVPYGQYIVYPFSLFGTFIHEAAHAMAAVLTGGQVVGMHVNLDTSGLTLSRGGSRVLISSAGYLGSVLAGAALLLAGRKRQWARPALLITGAATLLTTALFGGYGSALFAVSGLVLSFFIAVAAHKLRSQNKPWLPLAAVAAVAAVGSVTYLAISGALLTWLIGLVMGGLCLLIGLYAKPIWQQLTILVLGVQVALDGLGSLQTLWTITSGNHGHSDAANMADYTGVPATVWAGLWAFMAVMILVIAFWVFWRDRRTPDFASAK